MLMFLAPVQAQGRGSGSVSLDERREPSRRAFPALHFFPMYILVECRLHGCLQDRQIRQVLVHLGLPQEVPWAVARGGRFQMPGPPQASPEGPSSLGPSAPPLLLTHLLRLSSLQGPQLLAHQRWENVCWDKGYETSGQRRSRVCHLGCSRRLPCLWCQPVGQKRLCWEGAGVRSGIEEESGPGEGSRRWGWGSGGLGLGRPGSGGAQHPHLKHSWIQSRVMLDLVSWKSLLALSIPWNTWERGVASGMEGGKRVPSRSFS